MEDTQSYGGYESLEEVPTAMKNPSLEQMNLMIEAFLKKKKAYEAANPQPKKKVEVIKSKFSTGGGRPRRRYTKTVTMVKASNDGKLLRVAGRGRPKAGVERLKVDVPHDTRLSKGVEYKLVDGKLIEA